MSQDLRTEIDALRDQIRTLTTKVDALAAAPASQHRSEPGQAGQTGSGRAVFPREAIWRATEHLAQRAAERRLLGSIICV